MPNEDLLMQLKTALRLDGSTITEFARDRRKPNGDRFHRSLVYRAIHEDGPQWMIDDITQTISRSRRTYPSYYKKRSLSRENG